MPSCFDKWREWVKLRKQFKQKLAFTDTFLNPRRHALGYAFRKWQMLDRRLKESFEKIKH